jgi:hypothetical protein
LRLPINDVSPLIISIKKSLGKRGIVWLVSVLSRKFPFLVGDFGQHEPLVFDEVLSDGDRASTIEEFGGTVIRAYALSLASSYKRFRVKDGLFPD